VAADSHAARGDLRYHLDRMGNVAFLLDADGDRIEKYTYDAFAHPTVTDWNGDNPRTWSAYGNRFMFTGREYFPELGLYDFRNRFYHPVLGRFFQSDPMGFEAGDANLFRYCGHDPVNQSDPFGLDGNDRAHDYDHNDSDILGETDLVKVTGFEIPENPFADSATRQSIDLFSNFMHDFNSRGDRDPNGANPFTQPINLSLASPNTPFQLITSLPRAPITSISVAFGPGYGIQVTVSWDKHGQSFISFAGQIGKSWPVSATLTDNSLIGNSAPTASEISSAMKGLGWSASGGYYFGGQLAGPAEWSIFNPFGSLGSAGPANVWGVGLVTPQLGLGLGYTFQGPTLATPLPPYSPAEGH
jgi:RHS repeat-associated protein